MDSHSLIAAPNWRYSLFPLTKADDENIDIRIICHIAKSLIQEGEESDIGIVMHWAHILNSEQSTEGDWPVIVNARTGIAVGLERTCLPAMILQSLADILETTEFDHAIRISAPAESNPTTGDRHDTTERTE